MVLIPILVNVTKAKGIVAHENGRTSHIGRIPTMGGLAVFASFYLTCLLYIREPDLIKFNGMIAASFLILLTGMKDDMVGISALKKFGVQIVAASIVIFYNDVRITTLHGFLGIPELTYFWSYVLTLISIVGLVNCYNLIDGIDGLSAGIGIVGLFSLSIIFYSYGCTELCMISLTLAISMATFFPYNVWGKKNKIFLGDTGSLTLGFVIAWLIIRLNQLTASKDSFITFESTPAISLAIAFIPLFDTLRVFAIRILKNRSPLSADKLHIHHKLLDFGLTHFQITTLLVICNLSIIILTYCFSFWGTTVLILGVIFLGIILLSLPAALYRVRSRKSFFEFMN
jgi:UDP-N-acetylmuramyl pentapeptide phosphotransferase/UDP-N-acetylglucosamine-1-phosphate transferase